MSKFVNIAHILILGPNLPRSIILGHDNSKYYIHDLDVPFALSPKFQKNWTMFQFWDKISQILILLIISMCNLFWVPNFIKIRNIAILRLNLPKYLIKALGIYFIFGTKFFWNEGIDTGFNVKCVLLYLILIFLVFTWLLLLVI